MIFERNILIYMKKIKIKKLLKYINKKKILYSLNLRFIMVKIIYEI